MASAVASLSYSSPCGDWSPLADKFYRKYELYRMLWGRVDLSRLTVAAAPLGGLIAMIRNDRKIVAVQALSIKPTMYIYTSSGKLINQFQWDKGRLVAMGWTSKEKLVCVMEYGSVRLYDIHGDFVQISLGEEAKENGILDAHIWDSSIVVLTTNLKLVFIANFDEPRPKLLADPGLTQPPHSWTIIPPSTSLSKHVEVLLATNNTIVVIDAKNAQDQQMQQGPFSRMSLSPNGKFLALYTFDGRLWVVSSDFQNSLAEFRTNASTPPLQMVWCGNDSVLLHWEDTILMVGPSGDWIKYAYEGVVHIVTELDSARIISSLRCELLERVPVVTESVFRIGSTAPGAILFDAREHFEKESPKADENIRSIRNNLMEAVTTCIDAAGNEYVPSMQKALLKAASFGKAFLEHLSADRFVDMCRTIRVLNALRDADIGIPLTLGQYQHLGAHGVVDKLIYRREHLLARRICEYLKIPIDRVLIDWACVKVRQSNEDEESICRAVVDKMSAREGISFAEVAKAAHAAGRVKLAIKLLDYEPSSADQVPLLMSMQEDELALIKAVESYDTDLVYLVLLHLKRKLPTADFFRIVSGKPLASSLLEVYCREQDPQMLRDFYYQDDRRVASANLIFQESYTEKDVPARLQKLKGAIKLYAEDKETVFESKNLEDQCKLLQLQSHLERDLNHVFVDLSVAETILTCLVLGQANRAIKVKTDLKFEDRRYMWLELRAAIQTENWDGLERLAVSVAASSSSSSLSSSSLSAFRAMSGVGGGISSSSKGAFAHHYHKAIIEALVVAGYAFRAQVFVESIGKTLSAVALGELKAYLAEVQQHQQQRTPSSQALAAVAAGAVSPGIRK